MRTIPPGLSLASGLLASFFLSSAIEAQSIVGQWKLVGQTYGQGQSNLVEAEAEPFRIEFFRRGTEVEARIRVGDRDSTSLTWPRLVADDLRETRVEEKRVSAAEDGVFVRYRVDPAPGDDLVLQVTEEYRVVDDGRALAGTVRVEFERDGQGRGSYLLHRRFEREP